MERFQNYMKWREQLPEKANPQFERFIKEDKPLSKKLRTQWLQALAKRKDWQAYELYYQNDTDVQLQCYAQIAAYHNGKTEQALKAAQALWLKGRSQPKACDALFSLLTKDKQFNEQLITKRIVLALKQRNLNLARYLLKQYEKPRLEDAKLLVSIYQNPVKIRGLSTADLHDDFYLYGLKRMVNRQMEKAVIFWKYVSTKKLLSERQQQSFLSHIALYKAIRNHQDAYQWFQKIKPAYKTDVLINWQIRNALKEQRWQRVINLTALLKDKKQSVWIYWQGRAYEALGQKEKANTFYQQLADKRHYYGFLASQRLAKKLQFNNEKPVQDMAVLKSYKPFLEQVEGLYRSGQKHQASLLLNDFSSELGKDEASALAWWVYSSLDWPGKAVYLSNMHDDLHHQLALRFPLSYKNTVEEHAKKYTIPSAFIYAIIRQESAFRVDVSSRVGARGLMQLMPNTAAAVAKRNKINYRRQEDLFDWQKNITLGTAYLDYLSRRFNNHPILMAAAYNAGPTQVAYWLKKQPAEAIDIWIETLPWHETRNYLKNILAFYLVYQYRLNQKPDLSFFFKPMK